MKFTQLFLACATAGTMALSAADLSKVTEIKRWSPAECTVVQTGKAMTVNMPVDYKTGEKKYPVGWPRIYLLKLSAAEKDWSKAKALTFKMKLEFTGKSAKQPIFLQIRTQGPKDAKSIAYSPDIKGLVNNKTVDVILPLDKIKNLNNVTAFGFFISEQRYKHGDNVKFTVSDFKLINK
ncbi:MAG: hypothetical protein IKB99_02275 [Lentisphaeria bacterium]|nr:hypothetical protein [Lentisphaeria bacterium]